MEDARYFADGKLVVYKRNHNYYARGRFAPQIYVWKSLKTTDAKKAEQTGQEWFYAKKAQVSAGHSPTSRPFWKVIDEYVAFREKDHLQGGQTTASLLKQIRRIAKFWKEYAEKTPIESVDDGFFREYIQWRKALFANAKTIKPNQRRNPSDGTLSSDLMIGKAAYSWANKKFYRGKLKKPTYTFTRKNIRVRPAFSVPQFKAILAGGTTWHNNATTVGVKSSRELLFNYIVILALSGMRVGELNNLRCGDVLEFKDKNGRRNFRFNVNGKTGKREVIPRSQVTMRIDKIIEANKGKKPSDYFLTMPNGNKITKLGERFELLLKEIDITHDTEGNKFTLYSLRHFYAVSALKKGIGVFDIARNMGTSVQMIQTYYGKQATPSALAERLGD